LSAIDFKREKKKENPSLSFQNGIQNVGGIKEEEKKRK